MVFARELFDLQLSFAERVRDLTGVPLGVAVFEYTNLYVRLGFGRDFDFDCAGWQFYLVGLEDGADAREWTYRFYRREPETATAPAVAASFGCFSYAIPRDHLRDPSQADRVRLHFRNAEASDRSPLAPERVEQRRAELRALLEHLRTNAGPDVEVVGASWLYNLEAYRRLFPPEYVGTARPIPAAFRSMALWGQFVDRRGKLRASAVAAFLSALSRAASRDDLGGCFPFQALSVRAPARHFHDFYAVRA